MQRFLKLRETVFQNPDSFFRHYADLSPRRGGRDGAVHLARDQRQEPAREHRTRPRLARRLLLRKGADHRVTDVSLRRL